MRWAATLLPVLLPLLLPVHRTPFSEQPCLLCIHTAPLTHRSYRAVLRCAEDHITLGAELADGSLIIGQHQISHPSATGAVVRMARCLYSLHKPVAICLHMQQLAAHLPVFVSPQTFPL